MDLEALDSLYTEFNRDKPNFGLRPEGNFAVLGLTKRIASKTLQQGVELYFDVSPNQSYKVMEAATEIHAAFDFAKQAGRKIEASAGSQYVQARFEKTGDLSYLRTLERIGRLKRSGQVGVPPAQAKYNVNSGQQVQTSTPSPNNNPSNKPAPMASPGKKVVWDPTLGKYVEIDQNAQITIK